jgi:hypothetical protein
MKNAVEADPNATNEIKIVAAGAGKTARAEPTTGGQSQADDPFATNRLPENAVAGGSAAVLEGKKIPGEGPR